MMHTPKSAQNIEYDLLQIMQLLASYLLYYDCPVIYYLAAIILVVENILVLDVRTHTIITDAEEAGNQSSLFFPTDNELSLIHI